MGILVISSNLSTNCPIMPRELPNRRADLAVLERAKIVARALDSPDIDSVSASERPRASQDRFREHVETSRASQDRLWAAILVDVGLRKESILVILRYFFARVGRLARRRADLSKTSKNILFFHVFHTSSLARASRKSKKNASENNF